MEEVTDPQVVSARRALLDALEALGTQRDAVILVGAQAIYLHTGGAGVALAEFTTDADLAVDPTKLRADPLVQDSMMAGGFTPDPDVSALGTWRSRDGIPVDLLVPDAVAGRGRRSAKVPPHDERAMRRAVGLEAALVDFQYAEIASFESADSRRFTVKVAGAAALLVAVTTGAIDEHVASTLERVAKHRHPPQLLLCDEAHVATNVTKQHHRVEVRLVVHGEHEVACGQVLEPTTGRAHARDAQRGVGPHLEDAIWRALAEEG